MDSPQEIIAIINELQETKYIKKDIIKNATTNLTALKEYGTTKENNSIDTVIDIISKSKITANNKATLRKINNTLIKVITKYEEEYEEEPNEDDVNVDLTIDEIEEQLDSKVEKYKNYNKDHPMEGVSYDKNNKTYKTRSGNIKTSNKNLESACQIVLQNFNEKLGQKNGAILIPNSKITKKNITSSNNIFLIAYKYKSKRYYDIQHIFDCLKLKKSSQNEKYRLYSGDIKYCFWHPNKFGGFILRELISKYTIKKIIHRARTHNIIQLIKILNINVFDDKLLRKETICINQIVQVFNKEQFEPQKTVGKYYIDIYLPDHNIAIECDENGHKNRNQLYEQKRQKYIEKKLGCKFIRFNPDDPNFDIFNLLSEIHYNIK